jgi:hypothetical protein
MTLANLLRENLDLDEQDVWENERTPTPVRCFAVRLHSMGLSVREVEGVLDWLGVGHCYQAVWNWKEKLAEKQSDPPSENRHSFLRQWLAKFKGVSKHHLQGTARLRLN